MDGLIDEPDFTESLRQLDGTAICAIAGGLDAIVGATGDIERLEAMISIDRALRHAHLEQRGAGAARTARDLVKWAATRDQLEVESSPVVEVARTAADVARSLVAGDRIGDRTMRLLGLWLRVFGFRAGDDGLWLPA